MIVYDTGGFYISFKDAVLPETPNEGGDAGSGAPTSTEGPTSSE
jgi:hypothetical protein